MAAAQSSARHMSAIDAAAWDLPMWIASRRLGSLMVLGPPLQADAIRTPSVGWRPHDPELFPGDLGPARWSEAIYFRLLNCGLRLPPLAGSGSGWNSNPVGYNRVYVHLAGPLTEDAWWEGLTAGRVMITNGPLMLPLVNGEMPGHVFRAAQGQQIVLQPSLNLYTREKIDYLELIQDGRIRENIPLKDWVKEQGRLPSVTFDRSGWLIIRAVTDSPRTLRTVMTGPYYVQIGEQPAVSRQAAEFFREWAQLRKEHLVADQVSAEVLRFHRAALTYWQQQVDRANVD